MYQYVKSKQPQEFWLTWKKLFKNQVDNEQEVNEDEDFNFTSDENDAMLNTDTEAKSDLLFRFWIEFLKNTAVVFQHIFSLL